MDSIVVVGHEVCFKPDASIIVVVHHCIPLSHRSCRRTYVRTCEYWWCWSLTQIGGSLEPRVFSDCDYDYSHVLSITSCSAAGESFFLEELLTL